MNKLKKYFYLEYPKALTMEDWERWRQEQKTNRPFAYFFYDTLPMFFRIKKRNLEDFVWWFKHRLIKKHKYHLIDTGLKPDYYEIDTRMIHGCFSLLCSYVENQHGGRDNVVRHINSLKELKELDCQGDGYNYDRDIKNEQEVLELYDWWKNSYLKRTDSYLDVLVGEDYKNKSKEEQELVCKNVFWFEEQRITEETEMLIKLIKLRGYMWI